MLMPLRIFCLVLPLTLAVMTAFPATAQGEAGVPALPPLAGPVILTVQGLDPARFPEGEVALDIGRMAGLGLAEFSTSTIWTEGSHRYSGLLLADLLAALDPEGQARNVQLLALNDYAIDMPVAEISDEAPLLAYLEDGEPMPVRDKGPIWVIYPYDSSADYRTDTIYSRSVWQLDRITLLR